MGKKKENQNPPSGRLDFIEACAELREVMNMQLPCETYTIDGPMVFDADVIRSLKEGEHYLSALKQNKKR